MGKLWCNEELAARAKAGNEEYSHTHRRLVRNYFGISFVFESEAAGLPTPSPTSEEEPEAGIDCTASCITPPGAFALLEAK